MRLTKKVQRLWALLVFATWGTITPSFGLAQTLIDISSPSQRHSDFDTPAPPSAPRLPNNTSRAVDAARSRQTKSIFNDKETSQNPISLPVESAPRLPNRSRGFDNAPKGNKHAEALPATPTPQWRSSFPNQSLLVPQVATAAGIPQSQAVSPVVTPISHLAPEPSTTTFQVAQPFPTPPRENRIFSQSMLYSDPNQSVAIPIALTQAIGNSLTQKQVIHTLDGQVTVDLVTPLDPLIAAEQVVVAESRFDPTLKTAVVSDHIDLPPSSFTPDGLPVTTQRDEVGFLARITKEWATGATTSIGYEPSLAYLFLPGGNTSGFNPSHAADFVIQGTQPLLRNGGRNTNLANIRIANVREKQSVLLLQSKLQTQLKGIVTVYWNLHASHVRHTALKEAIALADQIYLIENSRYKAGRVIYADVARVGVNKESLIQQRLETERDLQRQSYQLSQIAGLPITTNNLLLPTDTPIHAQPILEMDSILALALSRNPNLLIQRNDMAIVANELQVARNQLRPQLDLKSAVRSGGLNDDLGLALKNAAQVEFVDFSLGLEYSRPFGNRSAQAKYRQLQLAQARTNNLLTAFEENVAYDIAEKTNSVKLTYAQFESAMRRLAEAQEWVRLSRARYENPPDELGPDSLLIALIDYQNAIQAHVDALFNTAQALADYNVSLCEIAELEGILLENWGIDLSYVPPVP